MGKKESYYLTADEITWQDEITADKAAAEQTFKIAIAYHQNSLSRIEKERMDFWERMARYMGYDSLTDAPALRIRSYQGRIRVTIDKDGVKTDDDT